MIESFYVLATKKVVHLCGVPWYAYLYRHADEKLCYNSRHDRGKDVLLYEFFDDFLMHQHDKSVFHIHRSHIFFRLDEWGGVDRKLIRLRSVYRKLCFEFKEKQIQLKLFNIYKNSSITYQWYGRSPVWHFRMWSFKSGRIVKRRPQSSWGQRKGLMPWWKRKCWYKWDDCV